MKENSRSLNKMYGDPQLVVLTNRIRFLKAKNKKMALPEVINCTQDAISKVSTAASKEREPKRRSLIIEMNKDAEEGGGLKKMKELRSQRYRETK
jgi:hypothetical protein